MHFEAYVDLIKVEWAGPAPEGNQLNLFLTADRGGALLPGDNPKYSYVGPAGRLETRYQRIFPQLNIDVAGNAEFTLNVILAHDTRDRAAQMGAYLPAIHGQPRQELVPQAQVQQALGIRPAIEAAVERLVATAVNLAEATANIAMRKAAQTLQDRMNGQEPVLFGSVKVQEPENAWPLRQPRPYFLQGARGAGHYEVRVMVVRQT